MPELGNNRVITIETNMPYEQLQLINNNVQGIETEVQIKQSILKAGESQRSDFSIGPNSEDIIYSIEPFGELHSKITLHIDNHKDTPKRYTSLIDGIAILSKQGDRQDIVLYFQPSNLPGTEVEQIKEQFRTKLKLSEDERALNEPVYIDLSEEMHIDLPQEEDELNIFQRAYAKILAGLKSIRESIVSFFSGLKTRFWGGNEAPVPEKTTIAPLAIIPPPVSMPPSGLASETAVKPIMSSPAAPISAPDKSLFSLPTSYAEDVAFQKQANELVKQAVERGETNTDFSLSKVELDHFEKNDQEMVENYKKAKDLDEAKYKFQLIASLKEEGGKKSFEEGIIYIEKTKDNTLQYTIMNNASPDPVIGKLELTIPVQSLSKIEDLTPYKSKILAQIHKNGHINREELNQAEQAYQQKPALLTLQKRYIAAINQAIAQFGSGRGFSVNGLCVENIQNVSGVGNNCGANVLFHIIFENLAHFTSESDEGKSTISTQRIIDAFKEKLLADKPELKDSLESIEAIKAKINELYPAASDKEKAFGPVVRKHLAEKLRNNSEYFNTFVVAILPMIDVAWDKALYEHEAYGRYQAAIAKGQQNDNEGNQDALQTLFQNRYDRLATPGLMITDYEIKAYAQIMGVDLRFYVRETQNQLADFSLISEVLNERGEVEEAKVRAGTIYLAENGQYVTRLGLDGPVIQGLLAEDVVKVLPKGADFNQAWIKSEIAKSFLSMIPTENLPLPIYRPGARLSEELNQGRAATDKIKFNVAANVVNVDNNHWQVDLSPSKLVVPELSSTKTASNKPSLS